jgi:hypothetical protein
MMNDLDAILTRLAGMPVPSALDGIEQGVFEGVEMRVAQRQRRKLGVVSVSGALLVGVLSAAVPSREAAAASSMAPLALVSPLSPAAILGNLG